MKCAKPRINIRSPAPASVRPFSSPGRNKRGDSAARTPTAESARNGQRAGLTDGRPLIARGQSAVRGRGEVEASRTPAKSSLPHRANGAVPTPLIKVKAKARVGVQKSDQPRSTALSAQNVMKRPAAGPIRQEVAGQPEDESSVSSSSSSSHSSCNSISCIQRNEEDEMSASTSTWGLGTGSALNSRLRSMSGTSEWDCELQQMSLLEFEDVEEQWREERKAEEQHQREGALTEDALTAQNVPQVTPCPYPSRAPLDLTSKSESDDDNEVEVDGDGFPSNVLSGTSAIEAGMSQSECHLEGSFSMRSSMPYEPSLSLNTNMMSHNGMQGSIGMGAGIVLHEEDQDQVLFRTTKCSSSYNDSSSSSGSNKNSCSNSAGDDSDGANRDVGKVGSSECTDKWDLVSQVPGKIGLLSDAPPTYERVWGAGTDYDVDEEEVEEEEEVDEEREVDVSVQSSSTVSASSTANMIRNLRAAGVDQCLSPLDSVRSIDFSSCDLLPSRPIEHGGQCGRGEWMRGREGECKHTETSPIEQSRPHPATDPSPSSSSSSAIVDSSDLHKSIVVSLSCLLFCVHASSVYQCWSVRCATLLQ